MALAYSYVRFSSPEQLKGDSLRRQLELSANYVEKNNLTLDTSLYLTDEAKSAFDGSNLETGALGAFIEAIDAGAVRPGSFLLLESLDRLSRAQVLDALTLFTSILKKGITIVTLSDGQVYSTKSVHDDWSRLVISITIMARAHEESAIKSKRLLAAWSNKINGARAGGKKISRTCPAWMRLSEDRTHFILIQDRVAVIQRLFRMVREGLGTYVIERMFNQEGIPPIGLSSHWHKSYLLNILRNRAVLGEYQYFSGKGKKRKATGDPIADYYPRIISDDEFYSVQKNMGAKRTVSAGRKGVKVPNLLSGLCKCGYCGGTMNYVDKGKNYDSQKFLVCSNAKRGIGCKHIPWVYSEVERLILNFLTDLQIEDISDTKGLSVAQEILAIDGRLDELRLAQENIVKAIEAAPNVSILIPRLLSIEAEITECKKKHQELEIIRSRENSAEQQIHDLRQLRKQLSSLTGEDLYRLRMRVLNELKQLLDWVQFFPDGIDPTSTNQYANPSSEDVAFHGMGQGREHRYVAIRFKVRKSTLFLFLKGIEDDGGIEKSAHDYPIDKSDD